MADVGSVIIATRTLIPDAAQVLPSPSGFTSAQAAIVPTLPAGSYLVSATLFTGSSSTATWGETLPTALANVTVDGTHGIQVTGALPVGAVKLRVYFGIGAIGQYQDFTSLPAVISTPGTAGVPPATVNRAYLPDSDGSFVSAASVYAWLNEAMDKATDIAGGILDVTGAPTIVGAGMYRLQGNWIKLTDGYFDGYQIYGGNRNDVFRRSPVSAIPGLNVRVTLAPQTTIELYPQPNRTAAVLSTTQTITASATSVTFSTTSGSLFSANGFALLGGNTASGGEIVAFYGSSGTLLNMARGLGGTQPQAWNSGTQVNELNLVFGGARRAVKHVVGDAAKTLLLPPGWESLLPRYMEARYRQVEHEWQEAANLMKTFEAEIRTQQAAYKQLSGPSQISDNYYAGVIGDTVGTGLGGRWYIP